MLIAISGTPCTGKTAISRQLAKLTGAKIISPDALGREHKIKCYYDRSRKTKIVDIKDLKRAVKKCTNSGINIVDSHLSHLLGADFIIILRTRPDVLAKRMKRKGWPKRKIAENVQAEILDTITIEALEANKINKIVEIDTTRRSSGSTAASIDKLLNSLRLQKRYRPGKIDWTKKFSHYLIKMT